MRQLPVRHFLGSELQPDTSKRKVHDRTSRSISAVHFAEDLTHVSVDERRKVSFQP